MILQPCNLLIERLPVLHQHFHPVRKGGITCGAEFGIVFDFLDRHPRIFQAFDKCNPCSSIYRRTRWSAWKSATLTPGRQTSGRWRRRWSSRSRAKGNNIGAEADYQYGADIFEANTNNSPVEVADYRKRSICKPTVTKIRLEIGCFLHFDIS